MRAVPSMLAVLVLSATILTASPVAAEEAADNPLAPFERVMGGEWHIEGSYQTFEWAVDKQSVVAKTYFTTEEGEKLVSQGMWFWHPDEKAIKGYFVATGMGLDLFVYTTRFEENRMVNKLVTYGGGELQEWDETWEFTGEDEYVWTLYSQTPEGPNKAMGDTYKRRASR
jgi:hypothetical protein